MTKKSENDAGVRFQKKENDAFKVRMAHCIDLMGGVAAAARKLGLAETTIRNWRYGRTDPQRAHLVGVAEAAGVRLAWLVSGDEPIDGPSRVGESAGPRYMCPADRGRDPQNLDVSALRLALLALDEASAGGGGDFRPEHKADLVVTFYDILLDLPDEKARQQMLTKLKGLAANTLAAYNAATDRSAPGGDR